MIKLSMPAEIWPICINQVVNILITHSISTSLEKKKKKHNININMTFDSTTIPNRLPNRWFEEMMHALYIEKEIEFFIFSRVKKHFCPFMS